MSRTAKQCERLLEALRTRPLTAMDILDDLGIARASARVYDLRADGWDIRSSDIVVRNRFGDLCHVSLYSLASTQMSLVPHHPGRGVKVA